MTKTFIIKNEKEMVLLAESFVSIAQKKDIFALYGTLGVGKTTFARAFIKKMTQAKEIPSPTFTLVQSYPYNDIEINHLDLYRIKDPQDVFELGFEDMLHNGITLIEWPEKADYLLPKDIFIVEIKMTDNVRTVNVKCGSKEKENRLEKVNV
jgi:tRNA threonylcarbamoyl adenosine modification protein YjeE